MTETGGPTRDLLFGEHTPERLAMEIAETRKRIERLEAAQRAWRIAYALMIAAFWVVALWLRFCR